MTLPPSPYPKPLSPPVRGPVGGPPLRPPMRTAPLVVQPSDVSTVNLARGALRFGRLGSALAMIWHGTAVNADEEALLRSFVAPPSVPSYPDRWLLDVQGRGRAVEALVGPGLSDMPPALVPIEFPSVPPSPGFMPWGDPSVFPLPGPAPVGPSLPGVNLPPPSRVLSGVTVSVQSVSEGVVVRVAPQSLPRMGLPRQGRDSKYSRPLVGAIMLPVTMTLGRWSEVQDAVEVLAANSYLRDGTAVMEVTQGDVLSTLQAVVSGEARVDVAGFGLDFALQQASDFGYAMVAKAQHGLAGRLAGHRGYLASSATNQLMKGSEEDVRFSWISSLSRRIRALDASRSERVRRLWP